MTYEWHIGKSQYQHEWCTGYIPMVSTINSYNQLFCMKDLLVYKRAQSVANIQPKKFVVETAISLNACIRYKLLTNNSGES